jgi:predicted RNA-binding Zn ribbon-like protein
VAKPKTIAELRLLGGALCLDFVNTIDPRLGPGPATEYLTDYQALLTWGHHAGCIDAPSQTRLRRLSRQRQTDARREFERALELRELLHRVFVAVSQGGEPSPTDLDTLNTVDCSARQTCRLGWTEQGLSVEPTFRTLGSILAPILLSAVDVLQGPLVASVRECPGADDCGWLFLDTTKNHSRTWCRSDGCGARVKMRRRYYAQKEATGAGT